MKTEIKQGKPGLSERFAAGVTKATGSTTAFILAFLTVIVWACNGPRFSLFRKLATGY